MLKYVLKRLLTACFILVGVSFLIYLIVRLMPTNVIESNYYATHDKTEGNAEALKQLLARYNLDDDSFWGILKGWWIWLMNFFRGDLGVSLTNDKPVQEIIFANMGTSFAVSFVSLILELIIAIPLGIKCACNQYGKLDYAVTVFTMIGISFPSFFFAGIIIKVFAVDLGWFEAGGLSTPSLPIDISGFELFINQCWHLILPIFVLTVLSIGSMMRYTRTNTLEVLNADYIRTARAKGLSENSVVYKHVFRNTLIPLITTLAGMLPALFGGSMIVEQMFSLPGIGNTAYTMTRAGDITFIMGYDMFIAALTVIGILLTDLMYVVVDPRVKLGK